MVLLDELTKPVLSYSITATPIYRLVVLLLLLMRCGGSIVAANNKWNGREWVRYLTNKTSMNHKYTYQLRTHYQVQRSRIRPQKNRARGAQYRRATMILVMMLPPTIKGTRGLDN